MNQDLQKTLSTYLDTLLSTLKEGAAFASDQIPLVIQEKLHYDLVMALIGISVGLFILGVALIVIMGVRRTDKYKQAWDKDGYHMCFFMGGLLALGAGGGAIAANLGTAVQIYFAPRLYILEWVQSMLTKH